MNRQPSKPTIRNSRIVQNSPAFQWLPEQEVIVRPMHGQSIGESSRTTLKKLGTHREPTGNKPVSGWLSQRQLGKLGGLAPAKSDGFWASHEKQDRSHLICPTIGPILLPTHPLHPSWKRSSTLSMTCIIGGSFFMRSSQFLGISGHSRPQLIEVQH